MTSAPGSSREVARRDDSSALGKPKVRVFAGASAVASVGRGSLAFLSLAFAALFLVISLARLTAPFGLEWIEGELADHVGRVLRGERLYVPPSVDFVPCIYTPLYYYVCAVLSKLTGLHGFLPLRLVSLGSSLVVAGLVLRTVYRETRLLLPAIVASGLFLGSYGLVDFWLDLGRVDALFLMLVASCLYVLRFSRGLSSLMFAAVLGALAIQTKQAGVVVLIPAVVRQLVSGRARGAFFAAALLLLTLGSAALLARDSWYLYYAVELPMRHTWNMPRVVMFWFDFLPWFLPCLVLAATTSRLPHSGSPVIPREARRYWGVAGLGMVLTAWTSWFHAGAARNVFLPACLAMAVMTGFALASFQRRVLGVDLRRRSRREAGAYGCVVLQFIFLAYDPRAAFPDAATLDAEAIVKGVVSSHHEAFLPAYGHINALSGRPSHAHSAPVMDLLIGKDDPVRDLLQRSFRDAVESKRFDAIVLPRESALTDALLVTEALRANYEWTPLGVTAEHGLNPSTLGVWTPATPRDANRGHTVPGAARPPKEVDDFALATRNAKDEASRCDRPGATSVCSVISAGAL